MSTLSTSARLLVAAGAVNALLAVALGAFGAHGLQNILSERALEIWHTAVDYHGFHALGLIAVGVITKFQPKAYQAGGWILTGILLFCGSLYAFSLSGVSILGMVTPLGGVCFMVGWGVLAWSLYQPIHSQETGDSV